MSSKSTADGWYFVSTGTGGIISVLRANLMVTFLLQGEGTIRFKSEIFTARRRLDLRKIKNKE